MQKAGPLGLAINGVRFNFSCVTSAALSRPLTSTFRFVSANLASAQALAGGWPCRPTHRTRFMARKSPILTRETLTARR